MPELNVELLDRTMARIEADPEHWDQEWWVTVDEYVREDDDSMRIDCGTSFCFAGWAAQLEGGKWITDTSLAPVPDDDPNTIFPRWVRDENGTAHEIPGVGASIRARRLLGLTPREADDLFDGDNSLVQLRDIVKNIKNGVYRRDEY